MPLFLYFAILVFVTQTTAHQSVLRNELDVSLNDFTMVDQSYFADYNASNVFPQDDTTLERLHNWLKPTKYTGHGSQLEKHASSHLEGTNQWLIDSPVFQQWHESNNHGILWIRGASGTGKSVLAAKLITNLAAEERPVLYFFFRRTIESNRRPEAALRDWITQILPSSPPLQVALKSLVFKDWNAASVDSLSMAELWHILQLALRSIPKAWFVVDALDEMDQDVMEEFLHLLDQLGNTHPDRVKLVITSRPVATIDKRARNMKSLDIRLNNDQVSPDILKYLHHRIDPVSPLLENREAIVQEILKKAGGLFQYAKLTMDTICEQEAQGHEEVLTAMDKASLSLLQEYMGRPGLPEELSIFVLQLVTHASRPLRLLEISDCIRVARPEYTQDIGTMKNLIQTSYGPLLEILPDETVRVAHHSLTEYLLRVNQSPANRHTAVFDSGTAHNALALLCLSYLQAGCLDTLVDDTECVSRSCITNVKNPQLSPFMSYAAANWYVHVTKSSDQGIPQEEVNDVIFSLLTTPQHSNKLFLLNKLESSGDSDFWGALSFNKNPTLETKALLISTHLNLTSFANYLLSRIGTDGVAAAAIYPGPPLHKAVLKENLDVVRLLVNKGANISDYDDDGRTPLHLGLGPEDDEMRPCHPIIKLLLGVGADPWQMKAKYEDSGSGVLEIPPILMKGGKWRWILGEEPLDDADIDDVMIPRPPIEKAFRYGNQQVAELFLPYLKSPKMAARAFRWVMLDSKNTDVMRSIMNLGLIDINACIDGETLLFTACTLVWPEAVNMLLEAGADPNIPRNESFFMGGLIQESGGETALHGVVAPFRYAVFAGEPNEKKENIRRVFESVVKAGGDVTQGNEDGLTPLHVALTPFAAKLLLDAGADAFAVDNNGRTPLDTAEDGAVAEVLQPKTDINTRMRNGRTALLQSLYKEDYRKTPTDDQSKIRKALELLDQGADPKISDADGNGPLHYLTKIGVEDRPDAIPLFERLVHAGVDISLRNNRGQTALHTLNYPDYMFAGMDSFKRLLELPNVDVNVADENGYTFLFNAVDISGNMINHEFVDLMVEAGAQFNVTDIRGRTLLHIFLKHIRSDLGPDDEMLKLLVEKGADPRQTDREGNSIWHEAARSWSGRELVAAKVFKTITALGVDPTKPNNRRKTPLHVMCEHDQDALRDQFSYFDVGNPCLFQYIVQQSHEGINEPDNDGIIPLHTLSTFSTDLTERLLDAGADATIATSEGLNAFHLASRGRQSNVIGVLIDWFKAKRNTEQLVKAVNAKDERGRGPLFYACASGRFQSVDLLIKAGAIPVLETYENSALQGLVEFEEELKNWSTGDDHPDTGAGAVYIDGTARPAKPKWERRRGSYHRDRIDDILSLLIKNTTSASWQGLDQAIVAAADRQHDYTVESLVRTRLSLGLAEPPPSAVEVEASLQKRAKLLDSTVTRSFSSQVQFMIAKRLYDAIPSYIKKYSPKAEGKKFIEVLFELSISGYASLLDALLTPEVIADLEKNTGSMEKGRVMKTSQDLSAVLVAACMSEEPNLHVIKLLIEKGAKADKIVVGPDHQTTALSVLVENAQHRWWQTEQALPYILEKGVDLEVRGGKGLTPLGMSLEHRERPSWRVRATERLLRAGANPANVNEQGKSYLASVVGHDSILKVD